MVKLLVVGGMGLVSAFAMAHGVHPDANEIQAALAAAPKLSDAYHGEVQRLRADSERRHRLSKHHESAKAPQQAATLSNKR